MEYNCFIVREFTDTGSDLWYPLADETSRSVRLNDDDGSDVRRAIATSVELVHQGKSKRHRQLWLDQVKAEILVTDSRVAFAIPKYDKGGGWIGGAGALALNAVSKARAAVRSRGTCFVGHVQHPWLAVVGHGAYFSLMGNRKHDQLRLGYSFRSQRGGQVDVWVEFQLARDVHGHALAQEILQRTIAYRLEHHPSLSDDDADELRALAVSGLPREVENGRWTQIALPATKLALPETARYSPPNEAKEVAESATGDAPVEGDTDVSSESTQVFTDHTEAEPDPPSGEPVLVPAAWYRDPEDEADMRYWNGTRWTEHVADSQPADDEAEVEVEVEVEVEPEPEPVSAEDDVDPQADDEPSDETDSAEPESSPFEPDPTQGRAQVDVATATEPVSPPEPASVDVPADWYPDPLGEFRLRYWDGTRWTDHTAD